MAELREWSAQALRYQGSDGPVKVMYFGSRLEVVNNDSFDQHDARRKNRPELDEQISFKASRASDTRAVFSGHLFDDLVEVLDSKNYKLQEQKCFEDSISAFEDLASKFPESSYTPRVAPLDLESSYGPELSYIGPIEPSEKNDLLFSLLIEWAINAKDIKVGEGRRDGIGKERKKEENKGENKEEKKEEEKAKKKEEEKEEKKGNKENDEEKRKREMEQKLKDLRHGITHTDVRLDHLCALIFGITTKFNPSGMWIVEDFFYDEEEVE